MKTIKSILFSIIVTASNIAVSAAILMYFWSWFIIDYFRVTPMSYSQTIGISMLVAFIKFNFKRAKEYASKEKDIDYTQQIANEITHILLLCVLWLMGYGVSFIVN
jgi:hypothetical protein